VTKVSNDRQVISSSVRENEASDIEKYAERSGVSKSEAARQLITRGMAHREGWMMVRDIGVAAVVWATASSISSVALGTPPKTLSMFSLIFAASILSAYAAHRVRWRHRDNHRQ